MARRMRSYGPGKDNGAVFINNCIAAHQKRKKAEEKEAAAASRRYKREQEQARRRREKEKEEARKKAEREAEKLRQEKVRLDKKEAVVVERLKLEFPKAGLYPGRRTMAEIAKKAVKAGVTPAKARSYFIDGKEDSLAESCAIEYLEARKILPEYQRLGQFPRLKQIVQNCRPQTDADKDPEYKKLKKEIDTEIAELIAKADRARQRKQVRERLVKSKAMFRNEIEDFAVIMEKNDWGGNEAAESDEYKQRIQNKTDYVAKVKAQIRPIKLAVAS